MKRFNILFEGVILLLVTLTLGIFAPNLISAKDTITVIWGFVLVGFAIGGITYLFKKWTK